MNAEEICQAAAAGDITSADAIAKLVRLGWNEADASEQVFIALGGDDVVEDDAQRRKNIKASRPGQ